MFDIYPDHKNVVTDADSEEILRAVNDRAIDILLVHEELSIAELATKATHENVVGDAGRSPPDEDIGVEDRSHAFHTAAKSI